MAQALALSENSLNDVHFLIKTRKQISAMSRLFRAKHALFLFDDGMYTGEQFQSAMRILFSYHPKYIVGIVPVAKRITARMGDIKEREPEFDPTLISIFENGNEKELVEGQWNFVYAIEDLIRYYFDHKIADRASLGEIAIEMQVIKLAPPYKNVDGYLANAKHAY